MDQSETETGNAKIRFARSYFGLRAVILTRAQFFGLRAVIFGLDPAGQPSLASIAAKLQGHIDKL